MHNSWTESMDGPMPLEAFHTCAKQTLSRLSALENSLQSAHQMAYAANFHAEQKQYILDLMQTISDSIQNLSQILQNTAQLPKVIVLLRYPLEVALSYMDKQISESLQLLEKVSFSRRNSARREKLLQALQHKIEIIMQTHQDILQRIPDLLDQSNFRAHKWTHFQSTRKKLHTSKSGVVVQFPMKARQQKPGRENGTHSFTDSIF